MFWFLACPSDDFLCFQEGDPEIAAALSKAMFDSEEEGGNSALATPRLSKSPSLNYVDDDDGKLHVLNPNFNAIFFY